MFDHCIKKTFCRNVLYSQRLASKLTPLAGTMEKHNLSTT